MITLKTKKRVWKLLLISGIILIGLTALAVVWAVGWLNNLGRQLPAEISPTAIIDQTAAAQVKKIINDRAARFKAVGQTPPVSIDPGR